MTTQNPLLPFIVNVPDIGTFTFGPRHMANQMKIECEYCRLTEGLTGITAFLANLAQMVADLSVLTVDGPKGMAGKDDILALDACDPETFARLQKVWSALCDKEAEFRGLLQPKAGGQGNDGDGGAVVAPPLQPGADRPEVLGDDAGGDTR